MKSIIFFSMFFIINTIQGQYDFVIKSLFPQIIVPIKEDFSLNQANEVINREAATFFELSNSLLDLCYYPKHKNLDCGYITINNQRFLVSGNYPHPSWGCDLDENSFELAKFKLGNESFVILTAINWGSGSSTKIVFCHLFNVTDINKVKYYPLWSMYGSSRCFGDYNDDGKIDFLQIRYDSKAKDNDIFRLNFSTMDGNNFKVDEEKYIIFKHEYQDEGLPKIIPLEEKW